MKKTSFSVTILIIAVLTVASFLATAKPAHSESNDAEWQLTVAGLVEHPFNLTMDEMQALPQTTVNAVLYCVDQPGYVVAQGNWTGVKLWYLLETAGVYSNAFKVAFYAADGYATDLTLAAAKRDDVIVAYQKDGLPLPETARLVVPSKWGYKWIAQLTNIELVNFDFKGKWESQGYTDSADITEGSTMPNPTPNLQAPYRNPSTSPSPSVAPASPTSIPSEPATTPSSSPEAVTDEKTPEFPIALMILVPLVLVALIALTLRTRLSRSLRSAKSRSS
jgi:DMSO/TMAO reductase YedYZ molybdopterin-dependent catalytic subunit